MPKLKLCEQEGCDSQPSFDIKGGKGRFCVTHKTAEMVDVVSKRCEHEGCDSRPSFDIKGYKGRFCSSHKMAEIIYSQKDNNQNQDQKQEESTEEPIDTDINQ